MNIKLNHKIFAPFLLTLIIISHVFIFNKLLYFPYPELFIYPYLNNNGLKPYSQILDQHFPGLLFLPINFDNLGMNTPEIAKYWSIGIIIFIHVLLFLIVCDLLKNNLKALLVNILYLIWHPFFEGWILWIDSFLPLFLLPGFYFTYHFFSGRTRIYLFLAGLFLGLGVVFKQTLLPLAGLLSVYILLKSKNMKTSLIFLVGLLIPIIFMCLYLVNIGVWNDFLYWTIVFNLTVYANSGTRLIPTFGFITRGLFVYAFSILVYFSKSIKDINLLFIFLIGSLIGIFDRADFIHLQPSLIFVVIATTLGIYSLKNKYTRFVLVFIYLFVTIWWLRIFYSGHISDTILLFGKHEYELSDKIKQLTFPREKIFVLGEIPQLYQLSNTLPSGNIFVFQFPWFIKVSQDRLLEGLIKDSPRIVVYNRKAIIEGYHITEYASKLSKYIDDNYKKIDSINSTQILQKNN